jgi:hypothetical protein
VKRTTAGIIVVLVVVAAVAGYLIELAIVANGGFAFAPPVSLPITLTAIAIVIVALAVPVRRRVTGKRKDRLDPFYAVRVAVLAKSSSLTGALLTGLGAGIIAHALSLPILNGDLLGRGIAQTVGAALLLTAGLVAERMCTLPPDKSDPGSPSDPTAGGSHV